MRRINTNHTLQDSTVTDDIELDYYHIKVDMSQDGKTDSLPNGQVDRSDGTSFPKLYINESKSTGGNTINATQNIQFEIARPNIQVMSLNGTNVIGKPEQYLELVLTEKRLPLPIKDSMILALTPITIMIHQESLPLK